MHQPHDYVNQPHDYIPTAVIRDERRLRINWATAGAYITAAHGLGVAIAVTALFLSYRETATTQMSQMRQALSTASQRSLKATATCPACPGGSPRSTMR